MDHDLTIMIYGAIMGVVGSILTSIVTTVFQFWLERREYERRRTEERRYIHLPTDEEIILINTNRDQEYTAEGQRKTAETGSIALSLFVGGIMVYQTHDPMLGFAFTFMLGFLFTNRVIRRWKG